MELEGQVTEAQLPKFTLNEAAYLAEVLWRASFNDPIPLSGVVLVVPGDPRKANPLSYPSNWGIDKRALADKLSKLPIPIQEEIVRRFKSLDAFPDNTRFRISEILKDWIRMRSNDDACAFLQRQLEKRSIKVA